jgi:hypothetical protein
LDATYVEVGHQPSVKESHPHRQRDGVMADGRG